MYDTQGCIRCTHHKNDHGVRQVSSLKYENFCRVFGCNCEGFTEPKTALEYLPRYSLVRRENPEADIWVKGREGVWSEFAPHCGDCIESVCETGVNVPDGTYSLGITVAQKASDFFGDYTILAVGVKSE